MTKKVLIVGAGPAGILLAMYLLRRHYDYQIDIYELRSDPRDTKNNSSNYPLLLCQRGIEACQKVENLVESIKSAGVEITGAISFNNNRKKYRSNKNKLISINRKTLVISLLQYVENNYSSERINIHFNRKYLKADLAQKKAVIQVVQSENIANYPTTKIVDYDVLIAADGVHSKVRDSCLSQAGLGYKKQQTHLKFKSLFVNSLSKNAKNKLELGRVYGWRSPDEITLLASRQKDETMSCTLFVPTYCQSVDNLQTPEEVLNFFQTNFPAIASSISFSEAENFAKKDLAKIWTVSCDRHYYQDNVLLIGDAAHAISPSIGQGCNSALEDVAVLDNLLDRYDDDWAKVLPEYSKRRVADANAVRELADHAMPLTKKMFALFIMKLTINRTCHRLFPQLFSLPFFDLISDSTVSYSEIHHSSKRWIALVKKSNERYLKSVETY